MYLQIIAPSTISYYAPTMPLHAENTHPWIQPTMDQKYLKQNIVSILNTYSLFFLSLFLKKHTQNNNYLHSIYNILGIISDLVMIEIYGGMYIDYHMNIQFYRRDFCIFRFWYSQESWNQCPMTPSVTELGVDSVPFLHRV
jgi:hypothetical protein